MADELINLWPRILDDLSLQMTEATFSTWLGGTKALEVSEVEGSDRLEWLIGVSNAFALDWLSNRLSGVIARTVERRSGRPARLRFLIHSPAPAPDVMVGGTLRSGSGGPAAGDDPEAGAVVEPDPDPDESGPMFEAVREERVTVSSAGRLVWTDFYIKFKVAFRKKALRRLKGARLSVFLCLALHVNSNGIAEPGDIEAIMFETGYARGSVCSALDWLDENGLIEKLPGFRAASRYRVQGYAWFGKNDPAPALFELSEFKK